MRNACETLQFSSRSAHRAIFKHSRVFPRGLLSNPLLSHPLSSWVHTAQRLSAKSYAKSSTLVLLRTNYFSFLFFFYIHPLLAIFSSSRTSNVYLSYTSLRLHSGCKFEALKNRRETI